MSRGLTEIYQVNYLTANKSKITPFYCLCNMPVANKIKKFKCNSVNIERTQI